MDHPDERGEDGKDAIGRIRSILTFRLSVCLLCTCAFSICSDFLHIIGFEVYCFENLRGGSSLPALFHGVSVCGLIAWGICGWVGCMGYMCVGWLYGVSVNGLVVWGICRWVGCVRYLWMGWLFWGICFPPVRTAESRHTIHPLHTHVHFVIARLNEVDASQ